MAQVRMMQGSWKLETVSQHEISISMCWSTKGRPESSEASEDDARELLTPVNPTDPALSRGRPAKRLLANRLIMIVMMMRMVVVVVMIMMMVVVMVKMVVVVVMIMMMVVVMVKMMVVVVKMMMVVVVVVVVIFIK